MNLWPKKAKRETDNYQFIPSESDFDVQRQLKLGTLWGT